MIGSEGDTRIRHVANISTSCFTLSLVYILWIQRHTHSINCEHIDARLYPGSEEYVSCVIVGVRHPFLLPTPRSLSCRLCGAISGRRGYTSRYDVLVFFRLCCVRSKQPGKLGPGGALSVSRVDNNQRNNVLANSCCRTACLRGEHLECP